MPASRNFTWLFVYRCTTLLSVLISAAVARADIYEWEYINPQQPELGKQQSTTLVPDGAGVSAGSDAVLANLDLRSAYLFDTSLGSADFQNSVLTAAYFRDSNLSNAKMSGTVADGADFSEATLSRAAAIGASFRNASFKGANLFLGQWRESDFQGADLSDADLNADWRYVNLSYANLSNSYFGIANLRDVSMDSAIIRGATFHDVGFAGLKAEQFYSTASYTNGDLSGIKLKGNLTSWNFSNLNLHNANFQQSDLTNATWDGADLTGASFGKVDLKHADFRNTVLSSTGFGGSNLSGVDFSSRDLRTVTFAGSNLTEAKFAESNLEATTFRGATLVDGNFSNSNLVLANLSRTDLAGAVFDKADIANANFSESNLTPSQLSATATYQSKQLGAIDFSNVWLPSVNLEGQELSNAIFKEADITGTSLRNANLSKVDFQLAELEGVDFTGANISEAIFYSNGATSLTEQQLYQTASYQANDLRGVALIRHDLTNWDLSGQNLENADFYDADLVNTNFTDAVIRGANFYYTTHNGFTAAQLYSTASYNTHSLGAIELTRIDISEWDLSDQDLIGASFVGSDISDVNLTGALIAYVDFHSSTGLTEAIIASTGSYQARDLRGIDIQGLNLAGWDLSDQYLAHASIQGNLTGTDLSRADIRGGPFRVCGCGHPLDAAITDNLIRSDGKVQGLNLGAGELMFIRDYDTNHAPLPILIQEEFILDTASTLHVMFDETEWGSTISFEPGIPVTLNNGTLNLDFVDAVDVSSQIGRTFQLFDWTGVTPDGEFTVTSDYLWDLSHLYTTGEVTLLTTLPGDYNHDGLVNLADYTVWRNNFGASGTGLAADGNGDAVVDAADYAVWKDHFGQSSAAFAGVVVSAVPEPASVWQLCVLVLVVLGASSSALR